MSNDIVKKGKATQFKSGNKAAESGRKGGIASGKAKRKKKALKEQMQMLLELPVNNVKTFNKMADFGIAVDEIDNNTRLVYALLLKGFTGDVQAIREIRSLIGEDSTADVLSKLDDMILAIEDKADEADE